jgi:predicted phage terminase large subunit-like protein
LLSRLDDKRTGAIVLVMQRVHMDDLTGFVTGESDEWTVLNLPAIAEADEDVPISATEVYHRKAGQALSVREPLSVLENLKRQLGSDAFSAQYQQMPVPPGGAMIKRDWIRRYDQLPPQEEWLTTIQSWDTASKGGPENDFSVCTTWVVTRGIRRWYLIDVWRKRVDYPELRTAVITLAAKHKAKRVLVEDAGAGTSLVQELRRGKVSGIVAVNPERDKVSRMAVVSAKFEAGEVYLPRGAPWLADFERELFAFPSVKYDDECDSVSQALSPQNYQLPMQISDAALAAADRPDQWYRNLR